MSELSGIDTAAKALSELSHAAEKVAEEVKKGVSNVHAAHEGRGLEARSHSGMRELAAPDLPAPARTTPDPGQHLPQMEADERWPPSGPAQHFPGADTADAGVPGDQRQAADVTWDTRHGPVTRR